MTELGQRKEDERMVRNAPTAPHLGYVTRKVGGAGDRFGDRLLVDCTNLPHVYLEEINL